VLREVACPDCLAVLGCQPAHDPRIDQTPPEVWPHPTYIELERQVEQLQSALCVSEQQTADAEELWRADVDRLQRENGSLARMSALTAEKLRERTGRLNQAIARLTVIVDAFDGECRLDHHGFCQEHLLTKPCEILEARRFLALASD
jgi:hypothetical protein